MPEPEKKTRRRYTCAAVLKIQAVFALAAVLTLLLSTPSPLAKDRVIRVMLDEDKTYPLLKVGASGKEGVRSSMDLANCPAFDDEMFDGAYRFELELAMLCTALKEADIADRFEFLPYPSVKRAVAEVEANHADLVGSTLFRSRAIGRVLRSAPTLRLGEFQVALFTAPNRDDVKGIRSDKEIQALRGITVKNWTLDQQALDRMGLQDVLLARKMTQIPQMIAQGRADFTLSYLDRPVTHHMGGALVRVDGFKVSLQDERIFVVSGARPDILAAIDRFIQSRRSQTQDQIRAAYVRAGFITEKYGAWQTLGASGQ